MQRSDVIRTETTSQKKNFPPTSLNSQDLSANSKEFSKDEDYEVVGDSHPSQYGDALELIPLTHQAK